MTPYSNLFCDYVRSNNSIVTLANDRKCEVRGVGNLRFKSGTSLTLKNIHHILGLTFNLMACSGLEDEGLVGRWVME